MKVTFYSPGTFVPEDTNVYTDLTDPNEIKHLARSITERHGAKPFGFVLENTPGVFYWLGGTIKTIDDVPDTPENKTLRWNMIHNHMDRIIENNNSWRYTAEFRENDVLLEWEQ